MGSLLNHTMTTSTSTHAFPLPFATRPAATIVDVYCPNEFFLAAAVSTMTIPPRRKKKIIAVP